MTDKKMSDAEMIAEYRTASIGRRGQSRPTRSATETLLTVKAEKGVFTVRFVPDAKPIAELGGATKVFGVSQISIPEFKIHHQ